MEGEKKELSAAFQQARSLVADYSSDSESSSSSSEDEDDKISISANIKPDGYKDPHLNGSSSESEESSIEGADLAEEIVKIENITITCPSDKCEKVGQVKYIVGNQVIVEPIVGLAALDLNTVLFLDNGAKPFGRIEETFGPVSEPLYIVQFPSGKDIKDKSISTGLTVYYAPTTEHTSYVFLAELLKKKGSDASWEHNQELPDELQEDSEDELECSIVNENRPRSSPARGRRMNNKRPYSCPRPPPRHMTPNYPPARPPFHVPYYPPVQPPPYVPPFNSSVPPPPIYQYGPPMAMGPPMGLHPLPPPPPPPQPGPSRIQDMRNWQNQS